MRYCIVQAALVCSVLNFAGAAALPAAPALEMASHRPPPADDRPANMARSEMGRPPFNIEHKTKESPPDSIEVAHSPDEDAPVLTTRRNKIDLKKLDLTQHAPKIAARNQLLNPHHNPHYINEIGEEVEFDPRGHEVKVHARPNDVPLMLRHKHYINEAGDEVMFNNKGQEVVYYGGGRGQKAPWSTRKHATKLQKGQFRVETNDAGESIAFDDEGKEHRLFTAEDGTVHAEHTRLDAKAKRQLKRDCVRQPHHKHCVERVADTPKTKRHDPCKKHPNGKKCQKKEQKEESKEDNEDNSDDEAELVDSKVKRELQGGDPCDKHPDGKKCRKQQEKEQQTDDAKDEPPGAAAAVSDVKVDAITSGLA